MNMESPPLPSSDPAQSFTLDNPPVPSTGPSTPDHAPSIARDSHPGVRRVHTLPAKLAGNAAAFVGNNAFGQDAIETLFVHPDAKVISFTVAGTSTRPGSAAGRPASAGRDASGTLPWILPSERTLAAGPLRIYRVPSSGVSFLNSGPLLHPILPRSQCWLVDEESKFVLRVREGSYYRIELPFTVDEEKAVVEEFKKVLATVLLYEKTSSPFRRGYVPETQEPPKTPGKKAIRPREKAKKWRLNKVWEPEDPEHRARLSPSNREDEGPASWRRHLRSRSAIVEASDSGGSQETTEDEGTATDSSTAGNEADEDEALKEAEEDRAKLEEEPRRHEEVPVSEGPVVPPETPRVFTLPIRPRPDPMRSVTAPPQLNLEAISEHGLDPLSRISSRDSDVASVASSHDSFHTVDEPAIPAEVTAQEQLEYHDTLDDMISTGIRTPPTIKTVRANHSRQISEITITPETPTPLTTRLNPGEEAREPSDPSTPTLISDSDDGDDLPFTDAVTPPDTIRLRRLPPQSSSSHALQPPNNYFISQAPSRKRAISAVLVQKAYSLLVGPPSHLVTLMLDIAARIVRSMQGASARKHRVPGAWGSSSNMDEDDVEWDVDEDDYGIPLDTLSLRRESSRSELRPTLGVRGARASSRASSVASSDYDALVEGPMIRRGFGARARIEEELD